MDRSFTSPLMSRSPFSPRARPTLSTKKVLPSSFRKSSRFSVSGKSTQSVQIILSTPYNYVERFGQPLPVLITEALTFADRNTVVSARISKHGYAWVVCGRRLLIWQYRHSPTFTNTPSKKHSPSNQCFELQLPQSDLAHRAELVSVFVTEGSSTPSCISVSPEGVIRYWPAIVHEGVSVEQHVNLQGQECDSLTDVEELGCILATTTCTVVLIQPQLSGGRYALKCKTLKIPTGWLGGLSKRMSSLIFGPIASENSSETGIVRVLSLASGTPDTWSVYVLADHNLQYWQLSKNDSEELIFVAELNRMIRDSFRSALWDNSIGDQMEIATWLLDIQPDKDGVIILAAAVNIKISPRVHYAMISLQITSNIPPTNIKDFLLLKMTNMYRDNEFGEFLSYRFLLCGTHAYLYNQKGITVIKPQEEPDVLEFNNTNQDFLLAGAICINAPIFFSRKHGLVAIASNEMSNDLNLSNVGPNTSDIILMNENVVNNLSIYNMDPEELSNACNDTLSQFKSAFIMYVKNQDYKSVLREIFPGDSSKIPGIDSLLDKVVVIMCTDLLDDIPANDPRWSKESETGLGSSYSMQVLHQLEDKQKVHSLFVKFLKDSGLWNQLVASTIRNSTTATVFVLFEMGEKIVAAISLKNAANSNVVEKAIKKAIANWETEPENGLTDQDVFFREVSQVHKGFQELVNYCEDVSHSNMNPTQIVDIINETDDILLAALRDVSKYREQNSMHFKPGDSVKSVASDFLPWTAAAGCDGLFNSLSQMHYLTYNYGVILTNNEKLRSDLLENLVEITDFILDGRKSHLESIKGTGLEEIVYKQYCSDRHKFIKPFLQEKEWERSARLAEKYLDFDTLITICESTGNQRRLDEYVDRFSNEGFPEHAYNWFLRENKQGKLINMCKHSTQSKNIQKLTNFLSDHPSLSWMQEIFDKKYNQAANTLHKLAETETESITRQKTMLSLCKLAKIASGGTDSETYVQNIETKLDLIGFQEDVLDYVLQQFGYDTLQIRVIPPKDLINLYICKEYREAGELEFKKALDLLTFIDDEELRQELLLKIWRFALLRDSWDHNNLDAPLEILQNKLFFKLVDLAMVLEGEGWNLLPPLDVLLDDESLAELNSNTNFQFLIKTGYEHIYRSQNVE